MDDIDLANEHNARFQDAVIRNRPKPRPIPVGNGQCFYCLDTVAGDRRWCSPLCRDAWEREGKQ